MARVSKKVSAAQREAENAQHRIWKTAIYVRLSDFDDVLRDAESLEVQISYIKEYINRRDDLMLLDVFADKRCTGTNFDRPEFERLLKALQERKINCIVVKDFSRLGRNFVETGQYLEQVFPLFGVRFIAINDNYDSLNSQSRDGMLVPIKSMINEMYSKDLSQKIQSCFRSKEARGEIKRIGKSEKIHGKAGAWCRTIIRRLSAGNCLMKFLHCGKLGKRSGMSGKSGADSAEKIIRIFSKAGYFAKSAAKNWFVIGKVMVRCIFTVHLAMFPFPRKTYGTASIRNCTSD